MNHLRNLGSQVSIPIRPDEEGYVGRECPVNECLGYFKITPGTGVKGPAPCFCPYCGHSGASKNFFTQEQVEYAKSVVMRQVTEAVKADLKSLEFEHKPRGGIGISMKLQPSSPMPLRYYREKRLETEVLCDNCTLRYAIYGVFGWCPDCGVHNSLQILTKNLELAKKELALAESLDKELADHLVGDALENVVSAFDGFGREICTQKAADIHFQNLNGARRKVQEAFGIDFADVLVPADWETACRVFQKRHLLAHRMGVVDAEYIQKVNDPGAVAGRKVSLSRDEVTSAISIIETLGRRLFEGILHAKP
ncbi:MAG: hypothetical protein WAO35_24935 [Terriglobia bacterium]